MTHSTSDEPTLKTCTKCGEAKPLTDFYVIHTGLRAGKYQACCRACHSIVGSKYRANNPEKRKLRDRVYHERNRDRAREQARRWRTQNPEKCCESLKKHLSSYPQRRLARGKVNDAVRRGHIPPAWTMVCENCQEAQAAEWHHHKGYEYEFALDVVSLCIECHAITRTFPVPDHEPIDGRTRLTKEQVMEIRKRVANGEQVKRVAESYGVARTTVSSIVHNRSWGSA